MSKLNKDVITLILKELYDKDNTLYPCLLVNRTWCETTVPILWKNPFRYHLKKDAHIIIINVILSYLSEESRDNLKSQGIKLPKTYQQPLLNYISFWKYLNLDVLERVIETFVTDTNNIIIKPEIHILGLEIMNIFSRNTKFYFLRSFSHSSFFIFGTKLCFSELESFCCNSTTINNILAKELAILNTSFKKLIFDILYYNHNPGIIKLIEDQKNLKEVKLIYKCLLINNESIIRPLEESLIKCADTIQYLRIDWKPVTKLFSYLVNLLSLEINAFGHKNWNHFEKISLPLLKYLKAQFFSSNILASLIENTKGNLIEISIIYDRSDDEGRLIQAIYQNCPNLNYLKLSLFNENISEFENLLINCRILNGLEIYSTHEDQINWKILFEILTRSTPISLFKFKFIYFSIDSYLKIDLESLSLFLDNWKDRRSMLLQIFSLGDMLNVEQKRQHLLKLKDFLQKYKTKGVIKNYVTDGMGFEDFEWIQRKFHTLYD
ncbi:hypothetical protein RhiirA1_462478 [Rhizophagus irregularis]|uniref:F-box domain-containing protein n=1 Tax=Rhizophagus irregularis TaxID=588596 RepID=A0A2N0RM63_9GLOM|nr:hypothetical protein RhiirA1_462478 [Rhizophagus irregularis]